jgi:hypothetical protein
MDTTIIIIIFIGFCCMVTLGGILGVYFSDVTCPAFGYNCPSGTPGTASGTPGPASGTPGPATSSSLNCTGRNHPNTAGTACESCSLPTGKGFVSMTSCETIDCPAGQYGGYGFTGCTACRKDDTAVPPGYILQGGTDDCAIIRCPSGTVPNSDKTHCDATSKTPAPSPPAGCTGYWSEGTQCNAPGQCGTYGTYTDTYVIPTGSAPCSITNGTTRNTRQCGVLVPCI